MGKTRKSGRKRPDVPVRIRNRSRNISFNSNWRINNVAFKKWLLPVADDPSKAYCFTCDKVFPISHGGLYDVTKHAETKTHTHLQEGNDYEISAGKKTFPKNLAFDEKERTLIPYAPLPSSSKAKAISTIVKKNIPIQPKPAPSLFSGSKRQLDYNFRTDRRGLKRYATDKRCTNLNNPLSKTSTQTVPKLHIPKTRLVRVKSEPDEIDIHEDDIGLKILNVESLNKAYDNVSSNSGRSSLDDNKEAQASAMLPQQYCLRWKYHHSNLQTMFSQLLERGCFCDVTLACDGQTLKAHRVVLSACSTYFDTILTSYDEKDPILIMKDVKFEDVKCLVEFMYKGEINVDHCNLASLLKTAEDLHIKGLAEVSWRDDEHPNGTQGGAGPHPGVSVDNLTTPQGAPMDTSNVSAELGSEPPNKKKRGRPPMEDFDDGYRPKITSVTGSDVSDTVYDTQNSNLVSVMLDGEDDDDRDLRMDTRQTPWMDQGDLDSLDYEEEDVEQILDSDPLDTNETINVTDTTADDGATATTSGSGAGTNANNTNTETEWNDVIKMNDYLTRGRRPQFWEEPFTKRVLDAIRNKDLEMKKAAEILGVSYGTLYGRYRDTYGCLKHPYRVRDMWNEQGPAEILSLLQRKIISLPRAAELLNVPPVSISTYLETMKDWTGPESDRPKSEPDDSKYYTDSGDPSPVRKYLDSSISINPDVSLRSMSDVKAEMQNSGAEVIDDDNATIIPEAKDYIDKEIKLGKDLTISTNKGQVDPNDGKNKGGLLVNHPDITIINLKKDKNPVNKRQTDSNSNSDHIMPNI